MTAPTSVDPRLPEGQRSEAAPDSPLSGAVSGTTPGAWLDSDIAMLKTLRQRTLVLAGEAAHYDTRLQRMFTDVEAEIRRALAALLLQREDRDV